MSGSRRFTVAAVIVSLLSASTTAIAATPAPVQAPAATAAGSWGTLSAMTGSSAATAALAQDYDRDGDRDGGFWHPSIISLAVILATIAAAIYIITKDDDDNLDFQRPPVSPN